MRRRCCSKRARLICHQCLLIAIPPRSIVHTASACAQSFSHARALQSGGRSDCGAGAKHDGVGGDSAWVSGGRCMQEALRFGWCSHIAILQWRGGKGQGKEGASGSPLSHTWVHH